MGEEVVLGEADVLDAAEDGPLAGGGDAAGLLIADAIEGGEKGGTAFVEEVENLLLLIGFHGLIPLWRSGCQDICLADPNWPASASGARKRGTSRCLPFAAGAC